MNSGMGAYISHRFTAAGTSLSISLAGADADWPDRNPILNGLTLETLGAGADAPPVSAGAGAASCADINAAGIFTISPRDGTPAFTARCDEDGFMKMLQINTARIPLRRTRAPEASHNATQWTFGTGGQPRARSIARPSMWTFQPALRPITDRSATAATATTSQKPRTSVFPALRPRRHCGRIGTMHGLRGRRICSLGHGRMCRCRLRLAQVRHASTRAVSAGMWTRP